MEALLLAVALGGISVAALRWARRARRGPEGPRLGFEARTVAHRGGAGERIENTLEAFEHAVNQGAALLELDVRRTRDGVAVVCHEPVGHLRFRELPLYRCPVEVTFSPGKENAGNFGGKNGDIGQFGAFGVNLGHFGAFLGHFGSIWAFLGHFG
ncbi:lysophospholipase D GDPD3-like [Corvus hawaiiensis]|uniref:lysophospholipase D GDPD3-like n=1 Tax=Corvus hawaiiensis TaxID=134902 RepID=UPI00201862E9|nr:lysophospholipase D GDPD3-like [Corvus hawaiiensis]